MGHSQHILVLMGPTASGKSAIGTYLAQKLDGVIINADAMQCYRDLRIITARPSEEEMAQAPHELYGVWDAPTHGNVAMWQREAVQTIKAVQDKGQLPIVLGGTGMYLKALREGIAAIPEISHRVREWVNQLWDDDPAGFVDILEMKDPASAKKLHPNDKQRLIRAMEVVEETGKPLSKWQEEPVEAPFDPKRFHVFYMDRTREEVYQRIDERFEQMVEQGVLSEVRALMAQDLPADLPIMKALGVPEMMAHLRDELSLDEAISKAQQQTRHYAKRQMTWLRGQCSGAIPIGSANDLAGVI